MRLLVVENNQTSAKKLKKQLHSHFIIDLAHSGDNGLFHARSNDYQIGLINLHLPDYSGFQLIKKIRSDKIKFPILTFGDCFSPHEVARALNLGADGFLPQPYAKVELLARIHALLRRQPHQLNNELNWQNFCLNLNSKTISYQGKEFFLKRKHYLILECLFRRANSIVTRQILIDQAWDYYDISRNRVDVQLSQLRKELKKKLKINPICTVRGFGYTLNSNLRKDKLLQDN